MTLPKRVVDFAIPLGQVIYKPGFVIELSVMLLGMAEYYSVPITPQLLIMSILVVGFLSMAAPPIPGGAISVFTVLFVQFGVPGETIALAATVNAVLDFFLTAANLACLQVKVALEMHDVGMLDEKKLKKSI